MKSGKIFDYSAVNQILPHKNKWAWDLFLKGCSNNWMPTEISMQKDIEQWKEKDFLTRNEKLVVKRCLGFFAGSESLVSNNLLIDIFNGVQDPECRQYIIRQAYEEALHNLTVVYICDSLNLDIKEVYEAYNNIPSIKNKDDFLIKITQESNQNIDVLSTIGRQKFLRNLITYYIICEGIFFYSGFAVLLSFGRQNKLPGISEQIVYSYRDEGCHLEFGVELINVIKKQYPELWTKEFVQDTIEHIKSAAQLEIVYANNILPQGILGLNSDMFIEYLHFLANFRLSSINISPCFGDVKNPFEWMTEMIEITKCQNFFEKRVTQYQVGTLEDDF